MSLALAAGLLLACPSPASAYIGPGAGFALLSSFFVVLTTIVLALLSLLRWPFRLLVRLARGRGVRRAASARRVIIVGFDGQEPALTEAWMRAGLLPHFAALAQAGGYRRVETTYPSVSPVAWSTFATGTNPGRHNIFDFLDRDPRSYLPRLSSTRIGPIERAVRIGRYRLPLRKPELRLLRRSQPFWTLLGEAGIWSTVLRVPITFPPDRFRGAQLSAMAAPDLLGTQGTFRLFTTRAAPASGGAPSGPGGRVPGREGDVPGDVAAVGGADGTGAMEGGMRVALVFDGDRAEAAVTGPENPLDARGAPLSLAMRLTRDRAARTVTVALGAERVTLAVGALSGWISIAFRAAPLVFVHGLCRLQLTEADEHVSIYMSPISLDPERPAMPISHPSYYAAYLAKSIGPFSTLGLAEDTWALNEGAIDEATFLRQTWDIDDERQRMFFTALDRLREGALVCVFDATDRVQHMCWRQLDGGAAGTVGSAADAAPPADGAIAEQYRRNDALLGRVMKTLRKDDVLMVLSDHGFTAFRRGVNLNRWLLDHGYLALRPGADGAADWLREVDWSRTRAYAMGLTGIFLNIKGREAQGIVDPGADAARVKAELIAGLSGLADDERGGAIGIRELFDATAVYDGPYVANAPDLLVGYNAGYRVSWACASGVVRGSLFEDNVKAWSGDHCVDPRLVPGVLFCSRPIAHDTPSLLDVAPTVLTLFGVGVPRHMEGTSFLDAPAPRASRPSPDANAMSLDTARLGRAPSPRGMRKKKGAR